MTLVGAVGITIFVYVLPPIFILKLRYYSVPWHKILICTSICITGIVGGVIGAYQAVNDLMKAIQANSHVNN